MRAGYQRRIGGYISGTSSNCSPARRGAIHYAGELSVSRAGYIRRRFWRSRHLHHGFVILGATPALALGFPSPHSALRSTGLRHAEPCRRRRRRIRRGWLRLLRGRGVSAMTLLLGLRCSDRLHGVDAALLRHDRHRAASTRLWFDRWGRGCPDTGFFVWGGGTGPSQDIARGSCCRR